MINPIHSKQVFANLI